MLAYLAAIRSCVQAVLALHVELPASGPGHPEAGVLAGEVEQALAAVADQVKGSPSVPALPPLRKEQLALSSGLSAGAGDSTARAPSVVLAGETDLLVDSIDALGHLFGMVG